MLRRLFDRESPFAAVPQDNPLFRSEVRQVAWGATPTKLWRSSLVVIGVVVCLMVFVWAMVLAMNASSRHSVPANISHDASLWSLITTLTAAFTLLDTPLLGMIGVWNGLNSFNDDVTAGRWDLLRLTPVPPEAVINARYASTQLRTWRVLMGVMGVRMGLVLLAALTLIVPPLLFPDWRGTLWFGLNRGLMTGLYSLTLVLTLLALSIIYIIEPLWRLRLIAAGAIEAATHMQTMPFMILYGLWRLVTIIFQQAMVAFLLLMFFLVIGILFLIPVLGAVAGVIIAMFTGYIIRSFYGSQIRQWRFDTVERLYRLWDLPLPPAPVPRVRGQNLPR